MATMTESIPTTVQVHLGDRSYAIQVRHDVASSVWADVLPKALRGQQALIVCDANTQSWAEAWYDIIAPFAPRQKMIVLPAGEAEKHLGTVARLYDDLADLPADRHTYVIAIGGGVLGDTAGFAAATYARGLPWIMVPTTLLAMVDSSVGGKVGVNHPKGKNLIGAFHQPAAVWIATSALTSLPDREFRSGLAEVVKYGVIMDAHLFEMLEAESLNLHNPRHPRWVEIIARCCRLKADVVEQDERETKGLRLILNYGHTFAHAFESVAGYGTWLHGEAVALGMLCASRLSERRGLVVPAVAERQRELLVKFGLPVQADARWNVDDVLLAMRTDKKARGGRLRFIVPRRLGEVEVVDDVQDTEVAAVLREVGCHG
jgi:3-dehydroquinate synthase